MDKLISSRRPTLGSHLPQLSLLHVHHDGYGRLRWHRPYLCKRKDLRHTILYRLLRYIWLRCKHNWIHLPRTLSKASCLQVINSLYLNGLPFDLPANLSLLTIQSGYLITCASLFSYTDLLAGGIFLDWRSSRLPSTCRVGTSYEGVR